MFHKTLSGLSQEVELTTVVKGRKLYRRTGSMLWTHFGISGPVGDGRQPLLDSLGMNRGNPSRSMETSCPVRPKNRRNRG